METLERLLLNGNEAIAYAAKDANIHLGTGYPGTPMLDYWNDANNPVHPASAPDYLPRKQLREIQLHRLRTVVRHAFDNVKVFRDRMNERKLTPESLQALEDLAQLPFTIKTDLRDTYPFGLFAVPLEDVVRLHASSGTTGKPIVVAYTQGDMDVWTSVMVRPFAACGVRRGDVHLL